MTHPWPPVSPPRSIPAETDERILGRLLERSDQMLVWQARIDWRLSCGDRRMDGLSHQASAIEARLKSLEERKVEQAMPGWEKAIKGALPYLILLGVTLATGSIEAAVTVLQALPK